MVFLTLRNALWPFDVAQCRNTCHGPLTHTKGDKGLSHPRLLLPLFFLEDLCTLPYISAPAGQSVCGASRQFYLGRREGILEPCSAVSSRAAVWGLHASQAKDGTVKDRCLSVLRCSTTSQSGVPACHLPLSTGFVPATLFFYSRHLTKWIAHTPGSSS